ncbi:MAG TPA: thioredoxin fold domain-containing protein [Thermoguttaceae bacterium]|nr:thioredoxin fold domain-containing protein [Thermoguttaceae bacterium]
MRIKIAVFGILGATLLAAANAWGQASLVWESDLAKAAAEAAAARRLVLIHFWAPWCTACNRMEQEVFSNPDVQVAIRADYVPVRLNVDHNRALAQQYGISSLPTDIIVTPEGRLLERQPGIMDRYQYVARLQQIATDARRAPAVTGGPQPTDPTLVAANIPANIPARNPIPPPMSAGPSPVQPPMQGPPAQAQNPVNPYDNNAVPTTNYTVGSPTNFGHAPQSQPVPPDQTRMPVQTMSPSPSGPAIPPEQSIASGAPVNVWANQTAQAPLAQSPPVLESGPSGGAASTSSPPNDPTACPFALDGFCPVELVENKAWKMGDVRWGANHRGRTYLFSGPEQQQRFLQDPDRYSPVASGADVVLAVMKSQVVPGRREYGVFCANRVFLFSSEESLSTFSAAPERYIEQLPSLETAQRPTYR